MKKKNENGDIRLIDANKALDDYSDMVVSDRAASYEE